MYWIKHWMILKFLLNQVWWYLIYSESLLCQIVLLFFNNDTLPYKYNSCIHQQENFFLCFADWEKLNKLQKTFSYNFCAFFDVGPLLNGAKLFFNVWGRVEKWIEIELITIQIRETNYFNFPDMTPKIKHQRRKKK